MGRINAAVGGTFIVSYYHIGIPARYSSSILAREASTSHGITGVSIISSISERPSICQLSKNSHFFSHYHESASYWLSESLIESGKGKSGKVEKWKSEMWEIPFRVKKNFGKFWLTTFLKLMSVVSSLSILTSPATKP